MIVNALAAIGLCVSLRQIARLIHWRFFVSRDGNSGRYRHWTIGG